MLERTSNLSDESLDRCRDYKDYSGNCPNTVVKNPKFNWTESSQSDETPTQARFDSRYEHVSRRDYSGAQSETRSACVFPLDNRDDGKPIRRSGEARKQRYCQRELLRPPDSQMLMVDWEKCEYCGGRADKTGTDGVVCEVCEKLGLELDQLIGASAVTG